MNWQQYANSITEREKEMDLKEKALEAHLLGTKLS